MMVYDISLEGFRNYQNSGCIFAPGINVIRGRNAQGKTNLLEAVYMLTGGRSFRTRFDRELISFDSDFARIKSRILAESREQNIEILLRRGGRKSILKNDSRLTGALLPLTAVLFSPEDLSLVRGGPARRRRLMDMAISQLRPGYSQLITEYNRLYEHKSRMLARHRDNPSMLDTLPEFNISMARVSSRVIRYRAAFVKRLAESARSIHREFSGGGEQLCITYKTVSTVTEPLAAQSEVYGQVSDHQQSRYEAELKSGQCLTGIHKDDLEISIDGESARSFASQGQTRTAALSIKLAEREIFLQETGEYPVLLLDDVLSELDSTRQEFVLNRIGGGQTLITCCEDDEIVKRTGGKVIGIDKGKVVD